jgi:predicted nucleic acid-binding protein
MNAVDTNVFIYRLDDNEPIKQTKAQGLLAQLIQPPVTTILPWQVAGELLSCLRKWESAGRITSADVEAHFRDVLALFPLWTPTAKVFDTALDLHARFSLSHSDTMLLAACKEAGVSTLYSEDLGAGTDYDGMVVVNPFA